MMICHAELPGLHAFALRSSGGICLSRPLAKAGPLAGARHHRPITDCEDFDCN